MRVQYPKLYNMTHLLALNVLLLPKDLTIIFIENYGHIHVYRAGADNLRTIFFIKILSICLGTPSKFLPFNYILHIFPIEMHCQPKLTLL